MGGNGQGTRCVPVNRKTERRESKREAKAEVAARVPQMVEMELLQRLRQGVYGRLHSLPPASDTSKRFRPVDNEDEIRQVQPKEECETEEASGSKTLDIESPQAPSGKLRKRRKRTLVTERAAQSGRQRL